MVDFRWGTTDRQRQEQDTHRQVVGGPAGRPVHPTLRTHPQFAYSNLPFTAQPSQVAAISANQNRVYLLIQNQGAINVFVSFGAPQGATIIAPNGSYELNQYCPNNAVYIFTSTGTCNCVVVEGVRI